MAYIPKNAEWYVAEIIEEIIVESDPRNVVHRNLVLVHASSPDEAYRHAMELGKQIEIAYQNPAGKKVKSIFRGLGELSVVHDALEHGAELRYSEEISVPEERITKLVRKKGELSVFCETDPARGPDYSSKEVLDEAYQLMTQNLEHKD
jgi:hypothetical protein